MFKTMGFPSTPLEVKQVLGFATPMNNVTSPAMRAGSPMMTSSVTFEPQFSFTSIVEQWNGKQVARWIEGLGEQVNPYVGILRENIKSGKQLEALDDDSLKKMGIPSLGIRKAILQAISLLLYFCHEAPEEDLQRLAQKVRIACRYTKNVMNGALRDREMANSRNEIVNILNAVSSSVLNVADHTKRLLFWLDRTPFDELSEYIEIRNKISTLIWNLLRNVNVQPKALFETAHEIIKSAKELGEECLNVMESADPMVLYATHIETATMKRVSNDVNWGLNIQSSYRGVHVISEIKEGSPADSCTKVDAGDEIIMINGRAVVGWDLTSLVKRLNASDIMELSLTLRRRPREAQLPRQQRITAKSLAPASHTSKTYSTDDTDVPEKTENAPLTRRRSFEAVSEIVKQSEKKQRKPLRRRITVGSCPRKEIKLAEDIWDYHDLTSARNDELSEALLASRGVIKRARTMRLQPDGYVRSFIDNQLVCDIEDDVVADQLTYNVKCPTDFAEIRELEKEEIERLNLQGNITDDEWKAPIQELESRSFRAPAGNSNISGLSLDSPVTSANRMTSSVEEAALFGVLPSPSTSSMNSVSSPALFKNPQVQMTQSLTEWSTCHDDQPGSPGTANYSGMEKLFEGWVRRRKTRAELSAGEVTKKWPKIWMCLKGHYLLLFQNQYVKRPDMTINLSKATISDSTDLKTSKKNIFRVTNQPLDYHFSCITSHDLKTWIQKMKSAKESYQNKQMSQSVSFHNEMASSVESTSQQQMHSTSALMSPMLMTTSSTSTSESPSLMSPTQLPETSLSPSSGTSGSSGGVSTNPGAGYLSTSPSSSTVTFTTNGSIPSLSKSGPASSVGSPTTPTKTQSKGKKQ